MTPLTREWVDKADGDYDVVSILLRSRKPSRYDPTCFDDQPCVEKYRKARLTDAGITYPKTHDLGVVLKLALPVEPLWATLSQPLVDLTDWAVLPRYSGTTAGPADARQAVKTCRRLREAGRLAFGTVTRRLRPAERVVSRVGTAHPTRLGGEQKRSIGTLNVGGPRSVINASRTRRFHGIARCCSKRRLRSGEWAERRRMLGWNDRDGLAGSHHRQSLFRAY